jgi:hypothetical protein
MIGLLFLATVGVWLLACIWLANKLGNMIPRPRWRVAAKTLSLLILIALPFVDEVIGKHQFEALCRTNGIESADVSKARGKTVTVKYKGDRLLAGTVIPIHETDVLFSDVETGEILVQYNIYRASGGWVMRYTWLSMESDRPMLFPSGCNDFSERSAIFSKNKIHQLK